MTTNAIDTILGELKEFRDEWSSLTVEQKLNGSQRLLQGAIEALAALDGGLLERRRLELVEEDVDALHKNLDEAGVPRANSDGVVYSEWGRVLRFAESRLDGGGEPVGYISEHKLNSLKTSSVIGKSAAIRNAKTGTFKIPVYLRPQPQVSVASALDQLATLGLTLSKEQQESLVSDLAEILGVESQPQVKGLDIKWAEWQLRDGLIAVPVSEMQRWRNVIASAAHPYESPHVKDIDAILSGNQEGEA